MSTATEVDAYRQGDRAAWKCRPASENPYPTGSREAKEWDRGWLAGGVAL